LPKSFWWTRGEAIAISEPPIEGLLGRDLTLTYAD
jgi:hypothetical protein